MNYYSLLPNTGLCARHTLRPKNTKTSEPGAEKGLLQSHARRVAHNFKKNPSSLKGFQQSPFIEKVREGGYNLLQTFRCQIFCSWGQATMFQAPSKQMLFSLLTRKSKVPRFNLHPLRSRPWLRGRGSLRVLLPCPGNIRPALKFGSCHCPVQLRRQLSAGGALRCPDLTQSSSQRTPAAPRDPQAAQIRAASHELQCMETPAAIRSQKQKWGERSPLIQDLSRSVGGWGEGLRGLQDIALILFLRPPAHQPDSLEGPGEETVICLSEHSQ